MIEREKFDKVIKGISGAINDEIDEPSYPYFEESRIDTGLTREVSVALLTDALDLLKAQKETIPIDFLMRYAQLPTEFAISAWKKPVWDALKKEAKDTDKPMSFDDALRLVNGILPINRGEER